MKLWKPPWLFKIGLCQLSIGFCYPQFESNIARGAVSLNMCTAPHTRKHVEGFAEEISVAESLRFVLPTVCSSFAISLGTKCQHSDSRQWVRAPFQCCTGGRAPSQFRRSIFSPPSLLDPTYRRSPQLALCRNSYLSSDLCSSLGSSCMRPGFGEHLDLLLLVEVAQSSRR